jgi:membrane protein
LRPGAAGKAQSMSRTRYGVVDPRAGEGRMTDTRMSKAVSPAMAVFADDTPDRARAAPGSTVHGPRPAERPGLWATAKRVIVRTNDDRILAEAASVTYYALLAIFPALTALISLYGLVADPSSIGKSLNALKGVVPGGGMQILSDQIHSLTATPNKALGLGAIAGLLFSLWSATAGVKSLFDALNAAYEEREKRGYFQLTGQALLFTLGALAFIMLALAAVVVVPAVLNFVGFGSLGAKLLAFGRWPLLLAAFWCFLAATYRYGPSRRGARLRWFSWGIAFSTVAWISGSALFSWYVANFGSYNRTYGSLGAAVGFMTWIWISTIIVLMGAELNAELECQAVGVADQDRQAAPGAASRVPA